MILLRSTCSHLCPLRPVVGGLAGWVAGLVRDPGGLRWAGLFGKTGVYENGGNAESFTLFGGSWVACSGVLTEGVSGWSGGGPGGII